MQCACWSLKVASKLKRKSNDSNANLKQSYTKMCLMLFFLGTRASLESTEVAGTTDRSSILWTILDLRNPG